MKPRQKIRTGIILFTFFLFPAVFYYLSPYLILEATSKGIVNGSFIVFISLFASSLVLGRAYCGWVCPAAGGQEALFKVRDKRIIRGNFIKWIIWIPWISMIVLTAIRNFGYQKIDFFYQTTYGLSVSDVYSFVTYLFVLLLVVLPAVFVGRRSFCHHLCWMAPFMITARKVRNLFHWPALRLDSVSDRCVHCHTCTENCPMSLPVEEMVEQKKLENSECILCGTCIDGCKSKAISYRFWLKNT
jgi:ferredoxin-type protein NapH